MSDGDVVDAGKETAEPLEAEPKQPKARKARKEREREKRKARKESERVERKARKESNRKAKAKPSQRAPEPGDGKRGSAAPDPKAEAPAASAAASKKRGAAAAAGATAPDASPATDPSAATTESRDPEPELHMRPPKSYAAGAPALAATLKSARREMGWRRTYTTLRMLNQKRGYDCPGCAWPEPGKRHLAEFCESGAKAVADEATRKTVAPEFFEKHSLAELADKPGRWLNQQGRLVSPVFKDSGDEHYRPISWDDAMGLIATELKRLKSPDEAAFYTSGRTSNEAAFAYQLFVRQFGTNNLPDCSNMCHESSGVALNETIGVGKGSVLLEDLHQADLIFVVGQNPGTNHPRMLMALERAKRRGARIIAVNPLPEAGLLRFKNPRRPFKMLGRGTSLADLFLQIRVNGDLALFRALNQLLVQAEDAEPGSALDREFISEHTDGYEAFSKEVRRTSWIAVNKATGLTAEQIDAAHRMVLDSKKIIVCWAMGVTQHRNSVATIREMVNFLLLRGNIGRPGAGVCPVRGHSNVQGDRTMGISEKPPPWSDVLGKEFDFSPPREAGLDTVQTIRAMRDGQVKVFMAMGGNFVSATPDTAVTEAAMRQCRLTVQVSTKLNRSHVVTGERALILPTLGRTDRDIQSGKEQAVSVEDSMGMVHASRGVVAPPSKDLLSEVAIICRLAREVLGAPAPWTEFESDYDKIRDRIAAVVPGFADFNTKLNEGFTLPHQPRDSRTFPTSTGKANFTVNPLEVLKAPLGRLILQTIRSHDQFNTTVYSDDDRYRGVHNGRKVVLVNRADMVYLGLSDGATVDIVSEWSDGLERRASGFSVAEYPTARGCCAAYFPETNVLVPLDSTAEHSNTPTSKSVVVRLELT